MTIGKKQIGHGLHKLRFPSKVWKRVVVQRVSRNYNSWDEPPLFTLTLTRSF